jgi:hypothetical protein
LNLIASSKQRKQECDQQGVQLSFTVPGALVEPQAERIAHYARLTFRLYREPNELDEIQVLGFGPCSESCLATSQLTGLQSCQRPGWVVQLRYDCVRSYRARPCTFRVDTGVARQWLERDGEAEDGPHDAR